MEQILHEGCGMLSLECFAFWVRESGQLQLSEKTGGDMINFPIDVRSEVTDILSRVRAFNDQHPLLKTMEEKPQAEKGGFSQMLSSLKTALQEVNHAQIHADEIKNQYLSGQNHVNLSDVLVTSEKSKVAFEGLIAVRNKFLEAYKEIMNIPI